jgi:hypothetical protein
MMAHHLSNSGEVLRFWRVSRIFGYMLVAILGRSMPPRSEQRKRPPSNEPGPPREPCHPQVLGCLQGQPPEPTGIPADEALDYLNDLGRLWRQTSDDGRRALASSVFTRLGAVPESSRQLHDRRHSAEGRIVSVEVTEYAERRGLVLALPARLEVIVVGDTGLEPVTSCMSSKCSNQLS